VEDNAIVSIRQHKKQCLKTSNQALTGIMTTTSTSFDEA
jgi:hypothetical protein